MALKRKGTTKRKVAVPKAGPKRRRFTEEERIRQAVDENTRTSKRAVRKSGRVHSYKYKEAEPVKERLPHPVFAPTMREPKPGAFLSFLDSLSDEQKPNALDLFRMECSHANLNVLVVIAPLDPAEREEWMQCDRCGLVLKYGSKTSMLNQEWMHYCPEGYDMFDWQDLFTRDKSLWSFIVEEAEAELVSRYTDEKEDE